MAGIVYGLIIGLIPAAGATTGLITLFGFMPYFVGDPYLGVIFCVAVVASSTTGDSFSGVLLGIPGANSAAATMVDGFPMAKRGEATRALSAAITSSTANGLLWGSLTFLFLPYYTKVVMYMGTHSGEEVFREEYVTDMRGLWDFLRQLPRPMQSFERR